MPFKNARFIKSPRPVDINSPAPLLRCVFNYTKGGQALLRFCAPGLCRLYINGKPISDDLFLPPVSDYTKTLWYSECDVTSLLREGKNALTALLGNGFFNECFSTPWDFDTAPWRGDPRLIAELAVDGKTLIPSDASWRCFCDGPIVYNQLRSGEYWDSRKRDPRRLTPDYDDSAWENAVETDSPGGVLRRCDCQPIRACKVFDAVKMLATPRGSVIYDFGQNMSGFCRLAVCEKAGKEVSIRYAEQINDDLTLQMNGMPEFYPHSVFAVDKVICNGEPLVFQPNFAYHGFRYVEVSGLTAPKPENAKGVWVHEAIEPLTEFSCSDALVNRLWKMGQNAVLSNLFYIITDCPSREKLGWANDAQASAAQLVTNFDIIPLLKKWLQDAYDSQRGDGAIPGIIPSSGWGYEWGAGPVSSGLLFELPYRIYGASGDQEPLINSLPYFLKHLEYIRSKEDGRGFTNYGLCDWAGPYENLEGAPTPIELTNLALYIKCLKIAELAAGLAGENAERERLKAEILLKTALYKREFLLPDGRCAVDEQSAIAVTIAHGLFDSLPPLAAQLRRAVEVKDYHHYCGMVGLPCLYEALDIIGASDYAYKILTANGYPSYRSWAEGGGTTLWETWQPGNSKNHHMYSSFMGWLVHTAAGLKPGFGSDWRRIDIEPTFIAGLSHCECSRKVGKDTVKIAWRRTDGGIALTATIPAGIKASLFGKALPTGQSEHFIKAEI